MNRSNNLFEIKAYNSSNQLISKDITEYDENGNEKFVDSYRNEDGELVYQWGEEYVRNEDGKIKEIYFYTNFEQQKVLDYHQIYNLANLGDPKEMGQSQTVDSYTWYDGNGNRKFYSNSIYEVYQCNTYSR